MSRKANFYLMPTLVIALAALSSQARAAESCSALPKNPVAMPDVFDERGVVAKHIVYPYESRYRLQYVGYFEAEARLENLHAFDMEFEHDGSLRGLAPVNLSRLKGAERPQIIGEKIQETLAQYEKRLPDLEFEVESSKKNSKKHKAARAELDKLRRAMARIESAWLNFEAGRTVEFHLWTRGSQKKDKGNPFNLAQQTRPLNAKENKALTRLANSELNLDRSPASGESESGVPSDSELGRRIFKKAEAMNLPSSIQPAHAAVLSDLAERYRKQFGCGSFKALALPTKPIKLPALGSEGGAALAGGDVIDFTN